MNANIIAQKTKSILKEFGVKKAAIFGSYARNAFRKDSELTNMNNQKGFANVVLIVLVVMLAGAVGYFALRKPTIEPATSPVGNNVQPTQPQVTPPPVNTTQTSPPSSQTNKPGWKVYAGAGFEMQYPENTFAVVQVTKQLPPDY
jgi:hypothetical protein